MSSPLRRLAATATTALVATALTVPLATPAQAVVTNQTSFLTVDTDGDGTYGLYTMPTPTGTQTAVGGVADSPLRDVFDLTATRIGGRVAYVLDTYASATAQAPSSEQVVVRDQGGQLVRVVASVSPSSAGLFSPALSPDGNTVVWSQVSASGVALRRADVGTGAVSTMSTSVADVVYANSSTLFGFNTSTGHAVALPAAGGTQTPINIPSAASQLSVSPGLNYVAWTLDKSTSSTTTVADLQLATLDLSTKTVGAATTLATGQNNHSPSWDVQSPRVDYIHDDGVGGQGDVKDVDPANPAGTVPTTVATPAVDEQEIDIVQNGDTVAPSPATALPAVLNGTSATVRWSLPNPADSDLSGVLVSRNGGSAKFVPKPLTSYVDTGLTLNSTYTYTIKAVDRFGNQATGVTRQLTAVRAVAATFADPTSSTSTRASFPVAIGGTAPASATWVVNVKPVGSSSWQNWVTAAHSGASRTFGSAATTGQLASTSTPGTSYQFGTKITDAFGNATPWLYSGHAVVPVDQTTATFNGGGNVYTSAAYFGSYRKLWHTTDYAKVTLTGNRLQVVGNTCGTCGKFDLFDNGAWVATVDTYGSVTRLRQVLFTKTYASSGTHGFAIKPRATAGRPDVMLDGFAMRR